MFILKQLKLADDDMSQGGDEPADAGPDVDLRCYYENVFYCAGPVDGLLTGIVSYSSSHALTYA